MTEKELLKMQEIASIKFDLNNIDSRFLANLIYHSLSFERKFITFEEVLAILENTTPPVEKSKQVLVENHKKAFFFLVNLVLERKDLTETTLKDCHEILMDGNGGLYRNVDISIHGSNHTPPSHLKVYDRMKKYFIDLDFTYTTPFEQIAYAHLQLAKIHPFLDGNGRLARLVLLYGFMKHGLIPAMIPHTDKENYFQLLEEFKVNKTMEPFVQYLVSLEKEYLE